MFWGIEGVWVFYLLALLAVVVFVHGVISHGLLWRKGRRSAQATGARHSLRRLILDGLLGRRIFKGDVAAGAMHLLILWGFLGLFLGTTLDAADHYFVSFLHGDIYLVFSTCVDLAGVMFLAGLLWALFRRYAQRVARLENRLGDLLMLLWLLAIAASGFLVEGLRLAVQSPSWRGWSFAGLATSHLWSGVSDLTIGYPAFWWCHAVLSLAFIAAIPHTKLFHLIAAPTSVFLADKPKVEASTDARAGEAYGFSARELVFLDACTRCGRCVDVCPSTGAGEPFSPRDFLLGSKSDAWRRHRPAIATPWKPKTEENDTSAGDSRQTASSWHCTTCRACLEVCPVYVATPDIVREVRRAAVERGTDVPSHLAQSLEKLFKYNNPWEASKKKRASWSKDLGVADLTKNRDKQPLCYFVGCTTAIDTRAQGLAKSFAEILGRAGVPFGTLGKKEPCCGDIARRVGEDGLFEEQMEGFQRLAERYRLDDIVTSSPHCYHTLHNEYALFPSADTADPSTPPKMRHYVEVLDELIRSRALRFGEQEELSVTYHDPCYLGRYNQMYDAPRRVLRAIPGVELTEMPRHGDASLCCGGGGGRMWQEELDADAKMSEIRIEEARSTGAQVLVTACPLCLIMLDDARKTAGLEDAIEVMDLNELVLSALEREEP